MLILKPHTGAWLVSGAKIPEIIFISSKRHWCLELAYMLDSLVRVSRRVGRNRVFIRLIWFRAATNRCTTKWVLQLRHRFQYKLPTPSQESSQLCNNFLISKHVTIDKASSTMINKLLHTAQFALIQNEQQVDKSILQRTAGSIRFHSSNFKHF